MRNGDRMARTKYKQTTRLSMHGSGATVERQSLFGANLIKSLIKTSISLVSDVNTSHLYRSWWW